MLFSSTDFGIPSIFSKHLYTFSILFLLVPLLIGQVTRGAVRWIPIGSLTLQPAEIVRPLLLVFFANYITEKQLNLKRLIKALLLLFLPVFLIVIQPSLGVAILTVISFLGVLLASGINKKYIGMGVVVLILMAPIAFQLLAPYQKLRVEAFIDPYTDPLGAGYNSIQSIIAVGSGGFSGKGLGKGVQTQLAFLPERHTDFIFASISEEMGFIGATLLLLGSFFILLRLTQLMESSQTPAARAYVAGVFFVLLVQTLVNVGMNLGLLPITGLPLPLVSAGGSSLISTMIMLGLVAGARR
jgi:rod shape determining protein RodA